MKIKGNELKTLIRHIIKETYSFLNEKFETGEWWIYPGGNVEFADGDLGDSNHESFVINHLIVEILDYFGISIDDSPDNYLSGYEEYIKNTLKHTGKLSEEELEEFDRDPAEMIIKKLLEQHSYSSPKQAEDAVMIAYGAHDRQTRDARDYAMKYLRWKRLDINRNNVIVQTWNLTESDIKDIAKGIGEAGNEWDNEDETDAQSVTIEVRSNNNLYRNIPYNELWSSDVIMKLGNYRLRSQLMNETFHNNKEWMLYEGEQNVTILFPDNTKLSLEVYSRGKRGEEKEQWRHRAASRWKSIANELHNDNQLSEVGNPIVRPWKECFKEALLDERMKEFIKSNYGTIFDPVNFTPRG